MSPEPNSGNSETPGSTDLGGLRNPQNKTTKSVAFRGGKIRAVTTRTGGVCEGGREGVEIGSLHITAHLIRDLLKKK